MDKICPLMSKPVPGPEAIGYAYCEKENCAWWARKEVIVNLIGATAYGEEITTEDRGCCAIKVLALKSKEER